MTDAEEFIVSSYEEIEELSCTNISRVVLVRNRFDGKLYIKRTLPKDRQKLYRKLKKASLSGTPGIEEIIFDGRTIVFEEFVEGISLAETVRKGIGAEQFHAYMTELLEILQRLHQQHMIHCDIKEENILVRSDNGIVLIDFAIARLDTEAEDISENVLGTVTMAAPEQFGLAPLDCRSDLYSFGKVCQNLLPRCTNLSAADKTMWEEIVDKCTEFYPEKRYQSAEEILKIVKQPAFFYGSKKEHLIAFAHMGYPPTVQIRAGEEKTVNRIYGANAITIREMDGKVVVSIRVKERIWQQEIFEKPMDAFSDYDRITEIFFLQKSLLFVRGFFVSVPSLTSGVERRMEYYHARWVRQSSELLFELSEVYESLMGYIVLGEEEVLLDKETFASYPLQES